MLTEVIPRDTGTEKTREFIMVVGHANGSSR
jgi:hypothetical protein